MTNRRHHIPAVTHSRGKNSLPVAAPLVFALFLALAAPAAAEDDADLRALSMFYDSSDLVVAASRTPRTISQTAENVTVVTAAEIAAMGAHTLADVLGNVPGIQTDDRGSTATFAGFAVHGADIFHILVLMDGVTLNYLGDSSSNPAQIPVQLIERVEIVKGAASSAWGSALGGVVNIVTKSPDDERRFGGSAAFSTGERGTRDSRGEASGTAGPVGYYLSGGSFRSDGFTPHTQVDRNNVYAKFRYSLPSGGNLLFTLGAALDRVDDGAVPDYEMTINDQARLLFSTAALHYPLSGSLHAELLVRGSSKWTDSLAAGPYGGDSTSDENGYGASGTLTWRGAYHVATGGIDYDHVRLVVRSSDPNQVSTGVTLRSDKIGIFLNDTIILGGLAVTPGVRYDRMNPVGEFYSASLGLAYAVGESTTLRAYAGRGYSLPTMVPGQTREKVFTLQAGAETSLVPFLWLKTSLFRDHLWDVQEWTQNDVGDWLAERHRQLKQGVEVEARTVPFFNTSLSGGYTFIDPSDRSTGERLRGVARQIGKVGVHFDHRGLGLKASLYGRYVDWNASPGSNARNGMVWDLTVSQRLPLGERLEAEVFCNGHNLFNERQYNDAWFRNSGSWFEGGLRMRF